jgi:transposase
MSTPLPRLLRVETVGDLPVLWACLQRLRLVALLEQHFPTPSRWSGDLSCGEVVALWLLHLTSQGDHCLNHLQPWVQQHHGTLQALLGKPFRPLDCHDDRLADLLDRLAAGDAWQAFETDLNRHTLRVYQLPSDLIRIDTTTANSYAQVQSERGLLQFGHSKDNPDLPQVKIAAAVLDPLGLPLTTTVVPGNSADDPLYVPTIQQVQQTLGRGGRTYVGDCKMAALATRAYLASSGDFYLCPLSQTQLSLEQRQQLLAGVWSGEQTLQQVHRPARKVADPDELVAEGFVVEEALSDTVAQQPVTWTERRWVVRSAALAASQQQQLEQRLHKAETLLAELTSRKQGKKRLYHAQLTAAAADIMQQHRVAGLLSVAVQTLATRRAKRAYGDRPAEVAVEVYYEVTVQRQEEAIAQAKQELGWQVYATNQAEMGLAGVVWGYRGQYRIEDDWSRLKGQSLGLTPLYLQEETRIAGLVLLLSVALRVLTLLEWVVRERLRRDGSTVQEVYAGQAGRKTARPSAELLLTVLKTISISVVAMGEQVCVLLSPLSGIQQRLLDLWDLPPDLYEKLTWHFPKPPPTMSEP